MKWDDIKNIALAVLIICLALPIFGFAIAIALTVGRKTIDWLW